MRCRLNSVLDLWSPIVETTHVTTWEAPTFTSLYLSKYVLLECVSPYVNSGQNGELPNLPPIEALFWSLECYFINHDGDIELLTYIPLVILFAVSTIHFISLYTNRSIETPSSSTRERHQNLQGKLKTFKVYKQWNKKRLNFISK